MELGETKTYPSEYPAEAVKVLDTMTFPESELKMMGSASLRSQKYSGDYDGYDIVKLPQMETSKALEKLVGGLQEIIRNLKKLPEVHIGDIKAGEIEEWRVVPQNKVQYSRTNAKKKLKELLDKKIISSDEAQSADLSSYVMAKKDIKFHIVRWTPEEILKGSKILRDGRTYTLKEALQSPGLVKIDVIAPVRDTYTDFSVIYELHNGPVLLNGIPIDATTSIKEDIEYYTKTKNPFKVVKRKFALAKLQNNIPAMKRYTKILNSDLGKLYVVYSDVKTLGDLLEAGGNIKGIQKKIEGLNVPPELLADLKKVKTKKELNILRHIEDQLMARLSKGTRLTGGFFYEPYKI